MGQLASLSKGARILLCLAPLAIVSLESLVLWFPRTRTLGLRLLQENGPVEWATFLALLGSSLLGCLRARAVGGKVASTFLIFFSLGTFLVAMEEISWGQWVLAFETPELVRSHNVQHELNLHNLEGIHSSLFHLHAAFGLGGLLGLLLSRSRLLGPVAPPRVLGLWFLIQALLGTLAIHVDAYRWPETFARCVRRISELNELLIGLSALLYVALLGRTGAIGNTSPRPGARRKVPGRKRPALVGAGQGASSRPG